MINPGKFAVILSVAASAIFTVVPVIAETAADNYKLYCVQCHGTNMAGGGVNARGLTVDPRDHTSAEDMRVLSDEDLDLVLRKGGMAVGKSSLMPPFARLFSEEEIQEMVQYLREACQCTYAK
ncbi:MAG: cytochrome c [Gammaproteobacteria bacterium]|nr:cytochrome c [Gammaproteobacteria bacterium]